MTTAGWLLATYLCPQTDPNVLNSFYRRIQPHGPGWKPVRDRLADESATRPEDNIPKALMNVLLGCVGIYALLFAVGSAIYGQVIRATILFAVSVVAGMLVLRELRKTRTMSVPPPDRTTP